MPTVAIKDNNLKTKLVEQSVEAIKALIQSAETTRRSKEKYINYMNSFLKEAKQHIL